MRSFRNHSNCQIQQRSWQGAALRAVVVGIGCLAIGAGLLATGNWHLGRLHLVAELPTATMDQAVKRPKTSEHLPSPSSLAHPAAKPLVVIEALPVARHKTHWANPIAPAYWQASGWTFTEDALASAATGSCSATFRQPFREVSFSTNLVPVTEPTTDTSVMNSKSELLRLQLVTDFNEPLLTMTIDPSRAVLATDQGDSTPIVLRDVPITIEMIRNDLRVVLTSDRLLTFWNEQVLWNVARPSAFSDQAFFVQVVTANCAVTLRELRFDSGR